MVNDMEPIEDLIRLAKLAVFRPQHRNEAFMASILAELDFEVNPNFPTLAVDANKMRCYVNEDFFRGLSLAERVAVLSHEAFHVALMHGMRMGDRNPQLWNAACDYVINNTLLENNYELPKDCLHDSRFINKSSEEVYEILKDEQDSQPSDKPNGPESGEGKEQDCEGDSPEGSNHGHKCTCHMEHSRPATDEEIRKIKQIVQTAAERASKDSLNAEIKHVLDLAKKVKVDWRAILFKYFDQKTRGSSDYTDLVRRYLPNKLYVANNDTNTALDTLTVAIDVSGSVTPEMINSVFCAIDAIRNQISVKTLQLITWHTAIEQNIILEPSESLSKRELSIGGGTDIHPLFEELHKLSKASVVVVLTDMLFDIPKSKPKADVIWLCHNENYSDKPQYGKLIPISL